MAHCALKCPFFSGGLAQFIEALEQGCLEKDVEIHKNSEVTELNLQENGKMDVTYQSVGKFSVGL